MLEASFGDIEPPRGHHALGTHCTQGVEKEVRSHYRHKRSPQNVGDRLVKSHKSLHDTLKKAVHKNGYHHCEAYACGYGGVPCDMQGYGGIIP